MKYIECNNLNLHNLRSISVKIPKDQFTVITGVAVKEILGAKY